MTAPRDIGMAECGSAASLSKCLKGQDTMTNPFRYPSPYPHFRPLPTPILTFRAVELVRQGMRRRDTMPGELARAAALLLGLEDTDAIVRLATTAEDQCAAARRALRANG